MVTTSTGPSASGRPTGTITFAFTDIEGSTQRWDRYPAAMQDALRRHDALLHAAITENGGHVFKTVGDAFCAAFWRPEDAAAAMLDVQRRVGAEDFSSTDGLRVRAAIHTGAADERDCDYFGPTLNRVARLLGIAHGGQVLLSGATTDLVRGALPHGASLRDLGEHGLKDLALPERVHQLDGLHLANDFPPLRSMRVLRNNLPLHLSTFVGREAEVRDVAARVERNRLVTVVGSGGVGKTRISLQVAADLLDSFGDGVWFVELAPLASGDYIPFTVAQTLGITLPADGDPVENLVRVLRQMHALLVFDNCEHLVEPAARAIAAILRDVPAIKVLASSRQPLGVTGEATYHVPSLSLPGKDAQRPSAVDALRYEAVALFVERARAANATFSLTNENAPIVVDICRRLDGIALAIELAAARVKVLGPQQLRDRLDERFRLLTGGRRDALPRQQTLRALIDWSYNLLEERERALFRRLGIFVDGFTLEGACAVGSGDELEDFDILASLVDKSLVLAEPQADAMRYRLLESTRAYAIESLTIAGERDLAARHHMRYLCDRFAGIRDEMERVTHNLRAVPALRIELEDVRATLAFALTCAQDDGARMLADIGEIWRMIGLEAEGVKWCEAYLAAIPEDSSRLRAALSNVLALLVDASGHHVRAFDLASQAVAYARSCNDQTMLAKALRVFAASATPLRRFDEAERALAEGEAIPGTTPLLCNTFLEARAILAQFLGDFETAARMWEQLREHHRARGNVNSEQIATLNFAENENMLGRTHSAVAIVRKILPAIRARGDTSILTNLLNNFASYLLAIDDIPGALAAARESVAIQAAREPDHAYGAIAIEHVALAVALRGDLPRAAVMAGYADLGLKRHGFEREFNETTTQARLTILLRDGLHGGELARLLSEGAALAPETAIALALQESPP